MTEKTTKTHLTGLTEAQVSESRAMHGENVLTPAKKRSVWLRFLDKFKDPLIIILIVAGFLSLGISIYEVAAMGAPWNAFAEPAGILIAILLATGLSFAFELKADKEFSLLNLVSDDELVVVIREGRHRQIRKREVVVGDIVSVRTGDEIPADGTLIEAISLRMDESSLTGEPSCVKTTDEAEFAKDAAYPPNMVLRGTRVLEGHGEYAVTAVGDATENGKVFKEAQIDSGIRTPLNEQLDRLGTWISRISYILAALVILGRCLLFFTGGNGPVDCVHAMAYLLESLMIAVTLIVVAVPEGLPMAVTLSLAYSMRRMLKTNNLVRKMHACETMGAATVICTDKTGTLTQNRMSVAETMFTAADTPMSVIHESAAVNSTAIVEDGEVIGNPTEGALLRWLIDKGVDYKALRDEAEVISELPFTTENKYMATLVTSAVSGKRILYVKGAPEIVYARCTPLPSGEAVFGKLSEWQGKAMRTLGFACKELSEGEEPFQHGHLTVKDLSFLGIAAISDPVRDDVPSAVRECIDAGIKVKIITGDTPGTAREIGRQIGIWTQEDGMGNEMTGPEIAALSDGRLREVIGDVKIISRARPTDKERIVKALQARGEVVAVTGDGTNDAPALNAAHVGLSMGDGTSVAKEASDITILDNSFTSIGRAVLWGRTLYRNIQRFILFQVTVNLSACLIVLTGVFMGTQSPLTVTQMLWINLIMDTFAAMALASLPPERKLMKDRPRNRKDFIINRKMMTTIAVVGGLMCLVMIGFNFLLEHSDVTHGMHLKGLRLGPYNGLSAYELSVFFTTYVFMQVWNLFNAKAFGFNDSAWKLKGCRSFLLIVLVIFFGQLLIVYFGGEFFNVEPLDLGDLLAIMATTSLIMFVGEGLRLSRRTVGKG